MGPVLTELLNGSVCAWCPVKPSKLKGECLGQRIVCCIVLQRNGQFMPTPPPVEKWYVVKVQSPGNRLSYVVCRQHSLTKSAESKSTGNKAQRWKEKIKSNMESGLFFPITLFPVPITWDEVRFTCSSFQPLVPFPLASLAPAVL